jgi:hypothetical protein
MRYAKSGDVDDRERRARVGREKTAVGVPEVRPDVDRGLRAPVTSISEFRAVRMAQNVKRPGAGERQLAAVQDSHDSVGARGEIWVEKRGTVTGCPPVQSIGEGMGQKGSGSAGSASSCPPDDDSGPALTVFAKT